MGPDDVSKRFGVHDVIFRTQYRSLRHAVLHQDRFGQFITDTHSLVPIRQIGRHPGLPDMPKQCSRRRNNVWWSIVSNAADRSSRINTETQPWSRDCRMSFCTLKRAVSVEWNFLWADWDTSWRELVTRWRSSRELTTFSNILEIRGGWTQVCSGSVYQDRVPASLGEAWYVHT